MKYIVFWEFDPKDMEKVIKKTMEFNKKRDKDPEKLQKLIFPPHSMFNETKGFSITESTLEQMAEATMWFFPEMKMKYVPIIESAKMMELFLKSKSE
jgi:hypothetical protein